MSNEVKDKIIEILAEQSFIEKDKIFLTSTVTDLGLDSLSLVDVIFSIEEMFDITIPLNANELDKSEFLLENVAAIVKSVENLISDRI